MFMLLPWDRIKQLIPIGLLATALILVSQFAAISIGLLRYNKALVFVLGIPLFQLFWAFAFGILLINYMKKPWINKLPIIALFTFISVSLGYLNTLVGNMNYLNGYNFLYDLVVTFGVFTFGVWLSEILFGDRIYSEDKITGDHRQR